MDDLIRFGYYRIQMQDNYMRLLLLPSLFSGTVSFVVATAVLALTNWSYILTSMPFYESLFGTDGVITAIRPTDSSLLSLLPSFTSSAAYYAFVIGAALVVGLVIYGLLQLLTRFTMGANDTWKQIHYSATLPRYERRKRLTARLTVLAIWIVYFLFSVNVILPFCIMADRVGLRALWEPHGFAYIAFGTSLLIIALHLHVILFRLSLLRVRVFGGEEALLVSKSR